MGRARPARGFPRGFPRLVRCVRGSKASNRTSRLGSDTGARASCCAAARPRRNEMLSRQQNVSKEWSQMVTIRRQRVHTQTCRNWSLPFIAPCNSSSSVPRPT